MASFNLESSCWAQAGKDTNTPAHTCRRDTPRADTCLYLSAVDRRFLALGSLNLVAQCSEPPSSVDTAKLWGERFGKVARLQSMKDSARRGKEVVFSVWAHSVLGSLLRPFCRTVPGPWLHTLCDFETHKTKRERVPKKKRKRCWVLRLHYWILTGIRRENCWA